MNYYIFKYGLTILPRSLQNYLMSLHFVCFNCGKLHAFHYKLERVFHHSTVQLFFFLKSHIIAFYQIKFIM
jgi:Fe2+ or Zn2+ uptake regulation protein